MKMSKIITFQKMLRKRLGDDLTYSLVLDNDASVSIYISAHASKTRQNKDKLLRCMFQEKDFDKELFILANEVAAMYQDKFEDKNEIK